MATIQELQKKILQLEREIERKDAALDKWRKRACSLRGKLETLEKNAVNKSELEQLRIDNDRLQVQVNMLKRHEKAADKLKQIIDIINK